MIVWSGKGYLVAVLTAAALIVTQLLVDGFLGGGYYTAHGWPKVLGGALAGVALHLTGSRLNAAQPRRLVDPATGREVNLEPDRHTFFFLRVEIWAPIVFFATVVLAWTAGAGTG